ncbi:VQ motif-containing protein [Corchorus capsularis]|uniref:VQ motif-containing protein n=1 Tax=Corchorus capsularis TaxID=210143 RepID=A0A1R3GTZ9_COCAP|nr:VQ motif-containing protein [Corchorus capsularis]
MAAASSSPSTQSPTTFVQADANTFRDLVQKLTGFSSDNSDQKLPVTLPGGKHSSKPTSLPVSDPTTAPRRSPFKLQERRQHTMRKLEIKLGLTTLRNPSPNSTHCCQLARRVESPIPSPVTPLGVEPLFYSSSGTVSPSSPVVPEEEKAIAEKGFYLHPSPLNTPRGTEPPELLTLFPLTSPSQERRVN